MNDRERVPELYEPALNKLLDRYLWENKIDPDAFEALTPLQREVIHAIDRSFSRLKHKYDRQTRENTSRAESAKESD